MASQVLPPDDPDKRTMWQKKLEASCQENAYPAPVYNIISDRRGARTAWSAVVTVNGKQYKARYWYDGQYVNNAREDAAEVAWRAVFDSDPWPPGVLGYTYYSEKGGSQLGCALVASNFESQNVTQHNAWSRRIFMPLILVLVLLLVSAGLSVGLHCPKRWIGMNH